MFNTINRLMLLAAMAVLVMIGGPIKASANTISTQIATIEVLPNNGVKQGTTLSVKVELRKWDSTRKKWRQLPGKPVYARAFGRSWAAQARTDALGRAWITIAVPPNIVPRNAPWLGKVRADILFDGDFQYRRDSAYFLFTVLK